MTPIRLHLSKPSGTLESGSSRFWGNPDLPPGTEYPTYIDDDGDEYPYLFLCQINLREVVPYDTGHLLPREGLLSFFAKIDDYLGFYPATTCIGGTVSDADAVRVLYTPSCEGLEEVAVVDEEGNPCTPGALRLAFSLEAGCSSDDHALFAPPTHRPWETWDPPFETWKILLQVDSFEGDDFSLNFMDVGVLDLLIAPDDLARHCFDNVRGIVLSS